MLIIGAGLSGIGAACYLQKEHPQKDYALLEARGISMAAVAQRLLADGLQLFSDAFDKLLGAVEKQRSGAKSGLVA